MLDSEIITNAIEIQIEDDQKNGTQFSCHSIQDIVGWLRPPDERLVMEYYEAIRSYVIHPDAEGSSFNQDKLGLNYKEMNEFRVQKLTEFRDHLVSQGR